jgi:hypothetical protein
MFIFKHLLVISNDSLHQVQDNVGSRVFAGNMKLPVYVIVLKAYPIDNMFIFKRLLEICHERLNTVHDYVGSCAFAGNIKRAI